MTIEPLDHEGTSEDFRPGPVPYRTAQERIAATLRRSILSGELQPGRRLTQNQLATWMGTSISPVREAVRQLAAEGLLRVDPNTRVMVPSPSPEEAAQVYELLAMLEPLAMRKAAGRMSDEKISLARDLVRQMDAERDLGNYSFLNWQFHNLLTAATEETYLTSITATLRSVGAIYVGTTLTDSQWPMPASNEEHREILSALIEGDADRAAIICERHLARLKPVR